MEDLFEMKGAGFAFTFDIHSPSFPLHLNEPFDS